MSRNHLSLATLLTFICFLSACSGPPKASTPGGGAPTPPGTNKPLTVTLMTEPMADQPTFTVLAFSAEISSLVLNDANGKVYQLPLSPSPYPVDFQRLTTDSALLSIGAIPVGVTFTNFMMAVQKMTVTIANGPNAIGTCAPNAVCSFSPAPSVATITSPLLPGPLAPGSDAKTNVYFTVLESSAIKGNSSGLAVNFAASGFNTVSAIVLPRKRSSIGSAVDLIQDFTGKVTAISATSITVTSGTGVAVTAAIGSPAPALDIPQSGLCPARTIASCVTVGSTVSVDASIASGGGLTAQELDLLDTAPFDAVEGTIFSLTPTKFSLVLTDKQVISGNATLTAANIGDIFAVTLDPASTYLVDTKNLTSGVTPVVPINFFQSSADFLSGQTVRLHVTAASGAKSTNDQAVTANQVQLRFTRVTTSVGPSSTNVLFAANTAVNQIFQVPTGSIQFQIQTYPGITTWDNGIIDNNGIGGLGTSALVAVHALFLKNGPPSFYATMVRDR